jgi:chaperonin cofactor prefoldin
MTIDEIKAQIQELEEAILECEKSLEKTTSLIIKDTFIKNINEFKQQKSKLQIELKTLEEKESLNKIKF